MIKRYVIFYTVLVVLFIGTMLSYSSDVKSMQSKLDAQTNEIYDLKNKIDVKKAEATSNVTKLTQGSTGLRMDRVSKDNAIAEAFIKPVLTWSSGSEYDAMRASIIKNFNLKDDSPFMKVFLPVNVKTDDGKYNYIDTHKSNCTYEDMETYVSDIGTDVYSYFAFVTWSASNATGNESSTTCVFTYDINADGKISNINAYTMYD